MKIHQLFSGKSKSSRKSSRLARFKLSNLSNNSLAASSKNKNLAMHEKVSIEDHWMENTRFLSYIQVIDNCFESSPRLLAQCKDEESSNDIIRRLATRSKHNEGQRVLTKLWQIGDSRGHKRHYVIAAYLQILEHDNSDGCWAVVERVMDRIDRCQSAQKQAFTLVIQHGALSYNNKKESHGIFTRQIASPADIKVLKLDKTMRVIYQTALQNIHFMVEDFLDTHKENAFKSALHEPARFYFHLCGNVHHRDHVNVHGLNGYLCLVKGWFGCQMPLSPLSSDTDTFKGCADIWSGLSEKAWAVFQDKANFGKDFEGIKGLNRGMLTNRSHGGYNSGHAFIGGKAADMEAAARRKDPRYLKYANKFAFFFEKEFLVRRMFEVLNAEGKPEYAGFRKACEAMYPLFRQEHGFSEDNFLEAMYDEEYILDVDRAARFFWFCGICKESEAQITWLNKGGHSTDDRIDNTCPICFEEKDDIEQIPHWNAKGDISAHKMCGDCTRQYNKNDCPFCHDVCLKDNILNGIEGFINEVDNRQLRSEPNELAALFEMWQIFEMEYANNPKIIHRVANHVVQDSKFKELLQSGVDSKAGWMRDAAGTIFRLYSLSMEGSLDVNDDESQLLARSYETIMQVARRGNECGHFYGALYSQAMAPYVCALQSGQSTIQLEVIIKEVGSTIVDLYKKERGARSTLKREVPERIIMDYMSFVTMNVWGGEEKDPVWKAFF